MSYSDFTLQDIKTKFSITVLSLIFHYIKFFNH